MQKSKTLPHQLQDIPGTMQTLHRAIDRSTKKESPNYQTTDAPTRVILQWQPSAYF